MIRRFAVWLSCAPLFIVLVVCACLPKRRRELLWGTVPLISNAYWAQAMRANGWAAKTLMASYYAINQRTDFDLYYDDFVPRGLRALRSLVALLGRCGALLYTFRNAKVVHINFHGWILGSTPLWRLEGWLLRFCGIKVIAIPYGADAYQSSQIPDTSLRHALLMTYPALALNEREIGKRVRYWSRHADCIVCGIMMEGMPRWDILTPCAFAIDLLRWVPKEDYSMNDGRRGLVRVIHTPNHRGFKGTEFLVEAVQQLRAEGLQVELDIVEKTSNVEVRRRLLESDILAEQFVATGYAFNGIEGMASGLPVLANLHAEFYTRLFRRYSFLDECPILSTTPESLVDNLRLLVTDPQLRRTLGLAGRAYAEKYHSYAAAQYLFGAIYRKLFGKEDVDLINLFHPLKSDYVRSRPKIAHPLRESRPATRVPA